MFMILFITNQLFLLGLLPYFQIRILCYLTEYSVDVKGKFKKYPGWRPEPLGNRLCIHADFHFSSCCSASQDPLRLFCLNFLVKFSNCSLFLPFRKRANFPSSRNPKPKISSPISISHEPGVSGVIKARKPRIIQIMPKDFRAIFFIRLKIRNLNSRDAY